LDGRLIKKRVYIVMVPFNVRFADWPREILKNKTKGEALQEFRKRTAQFDQDYPSGGVAELRSFPSFHLIESHDVVNTVSKQSGKKAIRKRLPR
jgi:hypothetical protein